MALGATWNPESVRKVGQIAGSELSAMGINMLLGPALDVYQRLPTERTLDLGVNSFGGEPYWVGEMGQAYVAGVHEGSKGRIAVIAQDFPGLGLADTKPDQEIPVLPRAVEAAQVRPDSYHAVTGGAQDPLMRADGINAPTSATRAKTSARSRARFALTSRPPTNSSGSICSAPGAKQVSS